MLALMLDSHFKSRDVVKVFVGWAKMIQIMVKYDSKTLLPLLVATFHFLKPTIDGFLKTTPIDDDSILRVMILNVATLHKLLKMNWICM
jgi:hypothetical protein